MRSSQKIKLSNIPRGYTISRGGLPSRSEKINLKAHSVYTISSTGMGAVECRIKYGRIRMEKLLRL